MTDQLKQHQPDSEPTQRPAAIHTKPPIKSKGSRGVLLLIGVIFAGGLCMVVAALMAGLAVLFTTLNDQRIDTVTSSGDTIFAEYFDSDDNGWVTGEFEDDLGHEEITIEDGVYTVKVTAKNSVYVERNLPNHEFSDFVLTMEATPRDSETYYSYGIAFRGNDDLENYVFEFGNDGLYAVFLFSGEWTALQDWTSSEAIKPGQTNEVTIMAVGSTLTFSVNGEQLAVVEDDTLAGGTISLVVEVFEAGQSAIVDFDSLVIREP